MADFLFRFSLLAILHIGNCPFSKVVDLSLMDWHNVWLTLTQLSSSNPLFPKYFFRPYCFPLWLNLNLDVVAVQYRHENYYGQNFLCCYFFPHLHVNFFFLILNFIIFIIFVFLSSTDSISITFIFSYFVTLIK